MQRRKAKRVKKSGADWVSSSKYEMETREVRWLRHITKVKLMKIAWEIKLQRNNGRGIPRTSWNMEMTRIIAVKPRKWREIEKKLRNLYTSSIRGCRIKRKKRNSAWCFLGVQLFPNKMIKS